MGSGRVLAVPAAPIVAIITQPDGTTFEARAWGDEHSNGVETVDGYTVLKDEQSGFWHYAEMDARQRPIAGHICCGRT